MSERSLLRKTEEKKLQIIRAAMKILSTQNYQNMKTARVAAEAGIAEGTIYRYFSGKKELFVAVLDYICESLSTYFLDQISSEKGLLENLNILKNSFLLPHSEISTQYKILYKAFSEVDDPEIKKALSGLFSSSLKSIQEILQSCLKRETIHITDEKLETMLLMIWGIGDILWKKQVILGDDPGTSNSPDIFVEMMTQLILQKED